MKKLEIEGPDNEVSKETPECEQQKNVEFSAKLVDYFSTRAKAFKKNNKISTTAEQLRKVYCHAARLGMAHGVKKVNLYALSRINMFLRLKSGDKMILETSANSLDKLVELELEDSKKCNRLSGFIDISESWIPSKEDLEKAQKEMDENDLKHEYDNIDDLYLEYKPIEFKWE